MSEPGGVQISNFKLFVVKWTFGCFVFFVLGVFITK